MHVWSENKVETIIWLDPNLHPFPIVQRTILNIICYQASPSYNLGEFPGVITETIILAAVACKIAFCFFPCS